MQRLHRYEIICSVVVHVKYIIPCPYAHVIMPLCSNVISFKAHMVLRSAAKRTTVECVLTCVSSVNNTNTDSALQDQRLPQSPRINRAVTFKLTAVGEHQLMRVCMYSTSLIFLLTQKRIIYT